VPSFDAKEKINYRIVQLMSMVVKRKYGLHDQHFTSCKSHTPVVNSTFHHMLLNFRITIDVYSVHIVSTKCSQRDTSLPPVQSAFWIF
jgi:hypothetical protein